MLVELNEEHTKCSICLTKFSSDRDNKDPEIRKHLPVLSSSQRCDHWFCHGCVLREQLRVAEENNGKVPKWIKCMHCREKTSFNPAEPKYHRLLIDLLARAQKYAAVQVKNEDEQMSVDLKRGKDTVDEDDEEVVVKRSKQMSPSPPLVQEEAREIRWVGPARLSLGEPSFKHGQVELSRSRRQWVRPARLSLGEPSFNKGR